MMNIHTFVLMIILFITVECSLYIVDKGMNRMMQLTRDKPFCYIYTDKFFIRETINNPNGDVVKFKTERELDKFEKICNKKQMESSYQGGFIYPGTKWCGPGAVAQNYSDLGNHKREDMCCREHDHCESYIETGKCRGKLCNQSPFTRSHCECDEKFKRCLQNTNSETGNTIGAIFFNVAQVVCFKRTTSCTGQKEEDCEFEFTLNDKYIPSESVHYYRTKGEVVEKYFNRALKRLRIL